MRTRRSPKNQVRLWRELGREKGPTICTWKEDWEGTWETGCKNMWVFNEGTPEENNMRFCCYCGKPLKQSIYVEDGGVE